MRDTHTTRANVGVKREIAEARAEARAEAMVAANTKMKTSEIVQGDLEKEYDEEESSMESNKYFNLESLYKEAAKNIDNIDYNLDVEDD